MRKIESLFTDYASYHRTRGNKAIHRIAIPMIMMSLFGMLERVDVLHAGGVRFDAAMLVIAAAAAYYFTVEWRLALPMLLVTIVFYFAGAMLPMWINVTLFVLGWILQFIGHTAYEKRQPAFFRNFVHLLVGPLWILNDVIPVVKSVPEMP